MDTLNDRIKEVRKNLGLSQKDFAEKIGISQRAVSWGEQPGNNVPDSTIKALCMAFHVNEKWLRESIGDMFVQPDTFSLDEFVKQHNGTELEIDIMKTYFSLPADIRKMMIEHFKEHLNVSKKDVPEQTVEEAEAEYIKNCSNSARRKDSTASNTTAGTEAKKASNE